LYYQLPSLIWAPAFLQHAKWTALELTPLAWQIPQVYGLPTHMLTSARCCSIVMLCLAPNATHLMCLHRLKQPEGHSLSKEWLQQLQWLLER